MKMEVQGLLLLYIIINIIIIIISCSWWEDEFDIKDLILQLQDLKILDTDLTRFAHPDIPDTGQFQAGLSPSVATQFSPGAEIQS